jgi:hypothetical protein
VSSAVIAPSFRTSPLPRGLKLGIVNNGNCLRNDFFLEGEGVAAGDGVVEVSTVELSNVLDLVCFRLGVDFVDRSRGKEGNLAKVPDLERLEDPVAKGSNENFCLGNNVS